MKVFFDTEFIEDGKTIELISIGMVREDNETYYAEIEGVDHSRADQWVKDNVISHLTGETKPRDVVAREIIDFVGNSPEFWAYYASYDWVALCQLFGRMIDIPKGWPMYCNDIKQLAGIVRPPKQTSTEHHALADAIWNKQSYEFIVSQNKLNNKSISSSFEYIVKWNGKQVVATHSSNEAFEWADKYSLMANSFGENRRKVEIFQIETKQKRIYINGK